LGRGPSYIGFNQEGELLLLLYMGSCLTLALVPIFDGRNMVFDPENLGASLATLPKWPTNETINRGAGIVAGYMTQASRYQLIWKITYYIQWIVVIAH
jgi:hypothetical protein